MSFSITIKLKSFSFEDGPCLDWNDIDWQVRSSELHVVTGPNGCGKSTFLKVLCGIYPHFRQRNATIKGSFKCQKQGRVCAIIPSIAGVPPASPWDITAGYVSQAPAANLVTPMEALRSSTVERELAFPLEHVCLDRTTLRSRIEWGKEKLEERGIRFLTSPTRLSKGQQQMVGVVSLLTAGPDLLILDEPTSFLDPNSLEWFSDLMVEAIKQERVGACVLSTQDKRLLTLFETHADIHHLSLNPSNGNSNTLSVVDNLFASINYLPHLESGLFTLDSFRVRTTDTEFSFGDLSLSPGDHAVILGKNGSGKSTFCEALTGYCRNRVSGHLTVGDWSQYLGFRKFAIPPYVSYAFQNAEDQITHVDLARELLMPPKANLWRDKARLVLSYIVKGGNLNPWKLSYGQRKLLVMLSLSFSSSVLLLDEPFSSLDDTSRTLFLDLLNHYLACGGIVISMSSDEGELPNHIKVFELKNGTLTMRGS